MRLEELELQNYSLSPDLVKGMNELELFRGRWEGLSRLAPKRLGELKQVTVVTSTGASTRIEGSRMTDEEVEKYLKGIEIQHLRDRDKQEVKGYARLLELTFDSYAEIPFNENHIKQLHRMLLEFSEKDERHRGEYKRLPNHVVATDGLGNIVGTILETATPFETPLRMDRLVSKTEDYLGEKSLPPLLVIPFFVVSFLQIHPFQDGNGRLSRALTNLLFLKYGHTYVPYTSHEAVIERNKQDYYLALRKAQTSDKASDGLAIWLSFFIRVLREQQKFLEEEIVAEELSQKLSDREQAIMALFKGHTRLTSSIVQGRLGISSNSAKDLFSRLVQKGLLRREGVKRGSHYLRA